MLLVHGAGALELLNDGRLLTRRFMKLWTDCGGVIVKR